MDAGAITAWASGRNGFKMNFWVIHSESKIEFLSWNRRRNLGQRKPTLTASMITYAARILREIDSGPGVWKTLEVGVFRVEDDKEELIGSYGRNYNNLYSTFFPFKINGKDYALYSPDYTATRIMELPSCKDFGGEESTGSGFCPVDYFVPSYIEREHIDLKDAVHRHRIHEPSPRDLVTRKEKWYPLDEKTGKRHVVEKPSYPVTDHLYYPYGFVAGCIWGDDSYWKIQYLDLSQVEGGIINRDERFGYIEMPAHLSLKQSVQLHADTTPGGFAVSQLTFAIRKRFDLTTGKVVEVEPFA